MQRSRTPPPPLWFLVLLVLLEGALWCALAPDQAHDAGGELAGDTRRAFWGIVLLVANAVWTGIQVAGKITLTVLAWSVKALWVVAINAYNAVKAVGRLFIDTAKLTWKFLEATYDHVLKPVWDHFWKWFDRARKWLQDIVRPVLQFLDRVKSWIMRIYDRFVRPILDIIGFARRALGILESLGIEWARKLDQRLAEIEEAIDRPFRLLLAEINKIVNVVNRIVTADGLFQRIAYLRTLARDARQAANLLADSFNEPLTDDDYREIRARAGERTPASTIPAARSVLMNDAGPYAARVNEWAQMGRKHLAG